MILKMLTLLLVLAAASTQAHNQSRPTIALTVKAAFAPIASAHTDLTQVTDGIPDKFWSGDSKKLKVKVGQSFVEVTPFATKNAAGAIVGISGWFEYQETPHVVVVDPINKKVVGVAKGGSTVSESEWAGSTYVKPVGVALLKAY